MEKSVFVFKIRLNVYFINVDNFMLLCGLFHIFQGGILCEVMGTSWSLILQHCQGVPLQMM